MKTKGEKSKMEIKNVTKKIVIETVKELGIAFVLLSIAGAIGYIFWYGMVTTPPVTEIETLSYVIGWISGIFGMLAGIYIFAIGMKLWKKRNK